MEEVVITQEQIDNYRKKHKHLYDLDRQKFSCKLCESLWRAHKDNETEYWHRYRRKRFIAGQLAYAVSYANGTVGYYHKECVDRLAELCSSPHAQPSYCRILEEIMRYNIDKWNGVKELIALERKKGNSKSGTAQIVKKRFNCSLATAYRKVRRFW